MINAQTWSGSNYFAYNTLDLLNNTQIKIYWDNETTPSVDAPLGSFFAMGQFGSYATRGLPVGMDAANNMYIYFPMPFQSHAKVQLVNNRSIATTGITYEVRHKAFTDSFANVGYFRTNYHAETPTTTGNDILILDTNGSGHLVGVVESMQGPDTGRWYLEGDERIYVDDSGTPSINGTGTEDFYNGGWYFQYGTYTLPMSGNTAHVVDTTDKEAA